MSYSTAINRYQCNVKEYEESIQIYILEKVLRLTCWSGKLFDKERASERASERERER